MGKLIGQCWDILRSWKRHVAGKPPSIACLAHYVYFAIFQVQQGRIVSFAILQYASPERMMENSLCLAVDVHALAFLLANCSPTNVSQAHVPHLQLIHRVMQNDQNLETMLRRSIDWWFALYGRQIPQAYVATIISMLTDPERMLPERLITMVDAQFYWPCYDCHVQVYINISEFTCTSHWIWGKKCIF